MPRIVPIPPREWSVQMRDALGALRPSESRHPVPGGKGRPKALNALGTFVHHPDLTRAFNTFNGHVLFNTTLTPRQRELLVLRVAALRACPYEWAQHVVLGLEAGLTEDEIRRVAKGSDADGWDALDRSLLSAAEELVRDAVVADDTWTALSESLDTKQVLDVVFTVGAYEVIAMAFRSFDLDIDDDLASVANGHLGYENVIAHR